MKRPHGAHPVTLCVVTAGFLVLHVSAIIYARHQIPKLEARVKLADPTANLERNFETDGIPVRNQPSGTLSGHAGMLAGYREIAKALPGSLWLTGSFFLGSLVWLRQGDSILPSGAHSHEGEGRFRVLLQLPSAARDPFSALRGASGNPVQQRERDRVH